MNTDFRVSRLRRGETIAALAAVVLIMDLFALEWYSGGAVATGSTGWEVHRGLRWLVLITCAAALGLAWAQATRRAPALPASLSVITTVLGAINGLALAWRVLLDPPALGAHTSTGAGAYLGLTAGIALAAAAVLSLREEDAPDLARNAAIPVIPLPDEKVPPAHPRLPRGE